MVGTGSSKLGGEDKRALVWVVPEPVFHKFTRPRGSKHVTQYVMSMGNITDTRTADGLTDALFKGWALPAPEHLP